MLTGKHFLAAAIISLFAGTTPAAESAEGKLDIQNPALPSQDDLVSFDDKTPVRHIVVTESGANQKAFPLLYGSQGATVTPPAAPHSAAGGTMVETGRPVHLQGGRIARTYVSRPVQEPPPQPVQTLRPASTAPALVIAEKADEVLPEQPDLSSRAQQTDDTDAPLAETAKAAVTDAGPPAQPIAAATAKVATDLTPAPVPEAKVDTAKADEPVPAVTPGTEIASAQTPDEDLKPATPVKPDAPEIATPPPMAAAGMGAQQFFPTETPFPMTSITPPPIPSSSSQLTGSDSHPTVGLAEFRAGKALDGTPLPPPPPMPELPARQKEPVVEKPDPAQVRADFNRLKSFCEEDSLGSAAEIYARMPDFGDDEEINRLRADAANLLILGLARNDNLRAARRIFNSVPTKMPGYDANLAKTRGIINLATYYVRAERFNDAFDVIVDLESIEDRSALNSELFRLLARMIPYLDNADETEKAAKVYELLLSEVKSPSTANLFADNIQGVLKYYLHYVDKSENPIARRKRMDFLEHIYSSLAKHKDNQKIRQVRGTVGMALADRYSGDPDRAALFLEDQP